MEVARCSRIYGNGFTRGIRIRGKIWGNSPFTIVTRLGKQTLERYRTEAPYAYIIPPDKNDPSRPVELLRRLAFNGIRILQIEGGDLEINGKTYPENSWVIPMDQEYAALARQVLKVQDYPDLREYPDGPPEPTL